MATPPERRLPRFGRTERALHWVHATAFLVLLGSGLCLYLPSLAELVGRRPLLKAIHIYTAVAWAVALVVVVAFGDRRALARDGARDRPLRRRRPRWLRGRRPQGRLNAGQKLNAVVTRRVRAALRGHRLLPLVRRARHALPAAERAARARLADVRLARPLRRPSVPGADLSATRHALSGITRGWVDEDWARVHHPKWAAEASPAGSADRGSRT